MRTLKNVSLSLALASVVATSSISSILASTTELASPPTQIDQNLLNAARAQPGAKPKVGPGHRLTGSDTNAVFFLPTDFLPIARAYAPERAQSLAAYLANQTEPGVGWDFVGRGGQVGPFLLTRAQLSTWGYTREQALADPVVQVRVHLASTKHLLDSVDLAPGQ